MSKPENWTKDQFYTFALIHAANADLEICDTESDYLRNKYGTENFEAMERSYFDMGEYERIESILACKDRYFKSQRDKDKLIDEMETMFRIDGNYSKLEKNLKLFFEKLL